MLFNTLVAATGLVGFSAAHIVISKPQPYAVPAITNGPLNPDGSNFPCQSSNGIYDAGGASNVMALGSSQPLAFTGTAVHGGGSCQVSITYDAAPNKNSVWKVIHSIEGGCPAKNTPGNLGNDPNAPVPFDYSFPVPADIPAGNGTIAWTWLNKVGNREFYMNCAPVTLTGSGGSKSNYDALPNMLVANIGNGCTTREGFDYKYPNAGKSVQKFASDLVLPEGSCGSVASPPSDDDEAPAPAPQPEPTAAPTVAPPAASPTTSTRKIPGGVFLTVTTPTAPKPTEDAPTDDEPAPPAAEPTTPPAPAPEPVAPPAAPVGGGAFAAGTACSPEGQWNCISGSAFQRCASGTWSAPMALAAGTSCKAGTAANIDISAAKLKGRRVPLRFRRFFRD